uniref:Dynein heavy chain linker domain-containing protein n=1 Tax=Glossina pallidipes TaxID=7398 RepID=A0A1A9ZFQ9_GLOPL
MLDCAKNPLVVPFCTIPGRLTDIQGLGVGLENCQKSLNEYLESKRRIFPRFYFISTDELLSILGSSEPSAVQNHIIKMYDNVKFLRLIKESANLTVVTAMISTEGEVLDFRQPETFKEDCNDHNNNNNNCSQYIFNFLLLSSLPDRDSGEIMQSNNAVPSSVVFIVTENYKGVVQ